MVIRIILIGFLVLSCNKKQGEKNMKIFQNTKEFILIKNSTKVTFSQAEKIFLDYHIKNEFRELETVFYYFEKGYYYFGYKTDPTNDKQNRSWYFIEIKVNAQTGNIIKLNEHVKNWQK